MALKLFADPKSLEKFLVPSPRAPISKNDRESFEAEIAANGVLEPVCLYRISNGVYKIYDGRRRVEAAIKLEIKVIPIRILS